MLTSYDGNAVTHDALGNILSFNGYTYTWQAGRRLAGMTNGTNTYSYKYDDNGIRTEKTVNGITTHYLTVDGRITGQYDETDTLYFRYNADNSPIGFSLNGEEYLYLKNIQGDVEEIVDKNGNSVVKYAYNEWGKLLSVTGSMATAVGRINPIRYRGYYYDGETGYYYLQSRYYNPDICRFINADEPSYVTISAEKTNYNLFAYCANDPVNYIDPTGEVSIGAIVGGIIGFGIGALIMPIFANYLNLRGWRRSLFIAGGTAVVTALGSLLGYYSGKALVTLYARGGIFAQKLNSAIARVISKITGASIANAAGNGWTLNLRKITLRIMSSGGGRTNYFRISILNKGALTLAGKFSSDRALTHIPITLQNIVKVISLIFKYR